MPTQADIVAARIGPAAFNAIVAAVEHIDPVATPEERRRLVAEVLTAASEYGGVQLPREPLVLNDKLTTKHFPGTAIGLTTKGLVNFYERRRWDFFVLRAGVLIRAFMGQNERLQELLALYEAQCSVEGVTNIPPWADGYGAAGGDSIESPFTMLVATEL